MKRVKNFLNKKIVISIVIISLVAGGFLIKNILDTSAKSEQKYSENKVVKGNIEVLISGSGAVTSSTKKDITSKVTSTVSSIYFKEGDSVKAGDMLVELDGRDINLSVNKTKLNIEKAKSSLQDLQNNLRDLNVKSPISGYISDIKAVVGDNVNNGTEIGTITDTNNLKLNARFNESQINKISLGSGAKVYLQDYMDIVSGTVAYISDSPVIISGGGKAYDVEINIKNPGTLKAGLIGSASIDSMSSIDSGTIEYVNQIKVRSNVSGSIEKLSVRENQKINVGDSIISLENDDINSQIKSAQIELEDLKMQLESQLEQQSDHKIYSPQDGTIIEMTAEVDDEAKPSETLLSVSNPKVMEFQIDVDELDIDKVKETANVNVSIDALPNKTFSGKVAKINSVGDSESGVTTFGVVISIYNPEGIKEGMNATGDIIIENKEDVLMLPVSVVQKMGNRSFVYVKKDVNTPQKNTSDSRNINTNTSSEKGSIAQDNNHSTTQNNKRAQAMNKLDPNVMMKPVEVGINNDSHIEIVSGLSEGDIVLLPIVSSSSSSTKTTTQSGFPLGGGVITGGNGSQRSSSQRNGGGDFGQK